MTRLTRSALCVAMMFLPACQSTPEHAGSVRSLDTMPDHDTLTATLRQVVREKNGGFGHSQCLAVQHGPRRDTCR